MKKRNGLLVLVLLLVMMFPAGAAYGAQQSIPIDVHTGSISFVIDGTSYAPPEGQQAFLYEDSTYVPLRFISYTLNKAVAWDQDTYTVTIGEPDTKDKTVIEEYKMNHEVRTPAEQPATVLQPASLDVYLESVIYVFDGERKTPPKELPGMIIDGSLYVPLRFFSESVGMLIEWDQKTFTVSASTKEDPKEPEVKQPEKPEPTNPTGNGGTPPAGGGTGSGNTGSENGSGSGATAEELTAAARSKAEALQEEARGYFFGLLLEYKQASAEEKPKLKQEGQAKLAEFDSRFDALINQLESDLENGSYDTSVLDEYRQTYEEEKAIAKELVK